MANQPLTVAQIQAVMKTYFVEEGALFESDTYDNRLFQLLPKMADAVGDYLKQPLLDGQIAGGSGDYASTKANTTAGSQIAFLLPWVNRYQMAVVDDKAARLTANSRGGFTEATEMAIKSAGSHVADVTNFQAFRAQNGAAGQLASGTLGPTYNAGTYTLTLTPETSVTLLQRIKTNGTLASTGQIGGTVLQFGDGGAAGIAAGPGAAVKAGEFVVTSIGETSFTVQPVPGIAAVAPTGSAYVYVKGDAQNADTNFNITKSLAGLQSWVPTVADSTTANFGGVDRSINWANRAGQRVTAAGSVHEALITAGNKALRAGAKTTHIIQHPDTYNRLVNELTDKQRYHPMPGKNKGSAAMPKGLKLSAADAARFGFDSVALSQYAGRTINIVPDWACQPNLSWMLDMSKFKFRHSKEGFPYNRGKGMDGNEWFRQDGPTWLLELFGIAQITCSDPSKQVVVIHS